MSFSSRNMTDKDWGLIEPQFRKSEFDNPEYMGYEFMLWLKAVRIKAGVPMVVSSSWRSRTYNKLVGGAEDSAHVDDPCNAIDVRKLPTKDDPNWNRARFRIVKAAMDLGCVRIGFYPNGSLHFDRTEDIRPAPCLWNIVNNPA
jgi:Peptidase M15.